MQLLKPKDLIAIVVLICITFLLFTGYDGPLVNFIGVLIGYYFGHRQTGQDAGV